MKCTAAQMKALWHSADDAGDTAERARIGREMAERFPESPGCQRRAALDTSIDKETDQ